MNAASAAREHDFRQFNSEVRSCLRVPGERNQTRFLTEPGAASRVPVPRQHVGGNIGVLLAGQGVRRPQRHGRINAMQKIAHVSLPILPAMRKCISGERRRRGAFECGAMATGAVAGIDFRTRLCLRWRVVAA